jgi:hypothetical protein
MVTEGLAEYEVPAPSMVIDCESKTLIEFEPVD